jgi:hypothetical protein
MTNTEQERYEQAQEFWKGFFRAKGFPEGFLGSADIDETEEEQLERELEWKKEHSCSLCGEFLCDGSCGDREYKMNMEVFKGEIDER